MDMHILKIFFGKENMESVKHRLELQVSHTTSVSTDSSWSWIWSLEHNVNNNFGEAGAMCLEYHGPKLEDEWERKAGKNSKYVCGT